MYVLFRFDPFDPTERSGARQPAMLAMDAVRNDDTVFVYFDAPGLSDDDIELTVEKNAVTVEASRRWHAGNQQILTSERPQGVFRRQIQFGENVDTDGISAELEHGVLTLSVPVKEGSKPRSISIGTSGGSRQLETSSS